MSNLISKIAANYSNLQQASVTRNVAFGVIFNNTTVGGIRLQDHASGKKVTGQVLAHLGYKSANADVDGDLDSL